MYSQPCVPAYLVRSILLNIHNDKDSRTLTSCQCVSKLWHQEGRTIRWAHVLVRSTKFVAFSDTLRSLSGTRQDPINLVRSLSVTLTGPRSDAATEEIIVLSLMVEWLPKMLKLQTISYTNFSFDLREHNSDMRTALNTKLVQPVHSLAICQTIENLEIDLIEVPGVSQIGESHMCIAVRQLLPKLRRLRYGRQTCCREMFEGLDTMCSKLEEILIDLSFGDIRETCSHGGYPARISYRKSAMRSLTGAARKVIDGGFMPKLVNFSICGLSLKKEQPLMTSQDTLVGDDVRFSCYYRVDMLKQRTTVFPAFARHLEGTGDIPEGFESSLPGSWMLYKDPVTGQDHNLIYSAGLLQDLVQSTTWSSSSIGVRLPAKEAERNNDLQFFEPPQVKALIAAFKDMRERLPIQTRLWYLQDKLKRPLLKVKEKEGTFYPNLPSCERLENEPELFAQVDTESQQILRDAIF